MFNSKAYVLTNCANRPSCWCCFTPYVKHGAQPWRGDQERMSGTEPSGSSFSYFREAPQHFRLGCRSSLSSPSRGKSCVTLCEAPVPCPGSLGLTCCHSLDPLQIITQDKTTVLIAGPWAIPQTAAERSFGASEYLWRVFTCGILEGLGAFKERLSSIVLFGTYFLEGS